VELETGRRYFGGNEMVHEATIVAVEPEDNSLLIVLADTIFHPQGGGQPADRGLINNVPVSHVFQSGATIFHRVANATFSPGDRVILRVDADTRLLNSRYHTAGHLIACICESFGNLTAVRAHHWPGEARIEFRGDLSQIDIVKDRLQTMCAFLVNAGSTVSTVVDNELRTVTIEGFPGQPCGGTHVSDIAQIDEITIRSVTRKGNNILVKYQL
jgi:Ser-tRNA(Ala) deacylase AlaX